MDAETTDLPPLADLEAAVTRSPGDVEAWLRLAAGYNLAEVPALGAEVLRHAVRLAPASADAHAALGDALIRIGRAQEAIPHCQEAARLDSDNSAWRTFEIGFAFAKAGDHATAVNHYRKALGLRPRMGVAWINLGSSLLARGKHAEAVSAFEKALACRPNNACILFRLGNAYEEMGDEPRAAQAFELALRVDPVRALLNLDAMKGPRPYGPLS